MWILSDLHVSQHLCMHLFYKFYDTCCATQQWSLGLNCHSKISYQREPLLWGGNSISKHKQTIFIFNSQKKKFMKMFVTSSFAIDNDQLTQSRNI